MKPQARTPRGQHFKDALYTSMAPTSYLKVLKYSYAVVIELQ